MEIANANGDGIGRRGYRRDRDAVLADFPAALERRAQKYLATHRERSRKSTDALGLEEDLSSYRRGIINRRIII